jgi:hypothetical protein
VMDCWSVVGRFVSRFLSRQGHSGVDVNLYAFGDVGLPSDVLQRYNLPSFVNSGSNRAFGMFSFLLCFCLVFETVLFCQQAANWAAIARIATSVCMLQSPWAWYDRHDSLSIYVIVSDLNQSRACAQWEDMKNYTVQLAMHDYTERGKYPPSTDTGASSSSSNAHLCLLFRVVDSACDSFVYYLRSCEITGGKKRETHSDESDFFHRHDVMHGLLTGSTRKTHD